MLLEGALVRKWDRSLSYAIDIVRVVFERR